MNDDKTLVTRILGGDPLAFTELVETYQQPVFNLAYRMLGDTYEAEDASQEAFLRAYRNLHRYDTERSFKTWLLTITSNHCIDRIRRRRLQKFSLDDMLPTHAALASRDPGPEAVAISNERRDGFKAMLQKLSPKYRAVVVLHYWYEMSCTEIAEALGTREGTVKSRLFRARRTLADTFLTGGAALSPALAMESL